VLDGLFDFSFVHLSSAKTRNCKWQPTGSGWPNKQTLGKIGRGTGKTPTEVSSILHNPLNLKSQGAVTHRNQKGKTFMHNNSPSFPIHLNLSWGQ